MRATRRLWKNLRFRSHWALTALPLISFWGCNALVGIDAPTELIAGSAGQAQSAGAPDEIAEGGSSGAAAGQGGTANIPETGGSGLGGLAGGVGGQADGSIGSITRVSIKSDGTQANNNSFDVSISGDGSLVAFSSAATNLVYFDFNDEYDIFLRKRVTNETLRVSLASNNAEPNASCRDPLVTADGKYVFFTSAATNLAETANKGNQQVFSRWLSESMTDHRSRGASDRVSSPAVSSEGAVVAYETGAMIDAYDTNGLADIYAAYGGRGKVERVSVGVNVEQPNGTSHTPSVSADGNLIAFVSNASNLVEADTNGVSDIFLRGLLDKNVRRVSLSSSGEQANGASAVGAISGDGKRVVFWSEASNLVPDDTNGVGDVFVHDLGTHKTVRVSIASSGEQANADSSEASISGDGRLVAFSSRATNLVPDDVAFPGDTNHEDVFVHDLVTHKTVCISVGLEGKRPDGDSRAPSISANGRAVAFLSDASNLVAGDSNGNTDAFVFDFR